MLPHAPPGLSRAARASVGGGLEWYFPMTRAEAIDMFQSDDLIGIGMEEA